MTTAATRDQTATTLVWCLHLLVAGLLALVAVRAIATGGARGGAVVAAAVVCGLAYAAGPVVGRRASRVWLAGVWAAWLVLLVLSGDAVWLAFPLYFLALHLLPRRTGLAAVAVTAVAAIVAFALHRHSFQVAMVIGPALGAAVAIAVVRGYEALYRESERRRRLIEELTVTRADLAEAQHTAGVLAERERLAREIHDTLAQGLSSIQLLLRAAQRTMTADPETAARHVDQARQAAADNLAEARRFVAALSPPSLDGTTLADALERLCATVSLRHPLEVEFHLDGTPPPLPIAHEVTLLRIAQAALANTVVHAEARSARVTLTCAPERLTLEIADDGRGFDTARPPAPDADRGGFGLAAMRARVLDLGGEFVVKSAPGSGTTLTARLEVPRPAPIGSGAAR